MNIVLLQEVFFFFFFLDQVHWLNKNDFPAAYKIAFVAGRLVYFLC